MPPNDTIDELPSWIWELDVTNGPGSATETWDDITAFVRGASIKRSRQSETGRDQAGTCQLTLDNEDRRFDWYYAGVTNLIQNPSLETNATGYVAAGGATLARSSAGGAVFGSFAMQATVTNAIDSGWNYGGNGEMPVVPGKPYAFAPSVWCTGGTKNVYLDISWWDAADGFLSFVASAPIAITATPTRPSMTATAPPNAHHARVALATSSAQGVFALYADGLQFQQGSAATTYVDGTQAGGHWYGTAHASKSYTGSPFYPNLKPMRRVRGRSAYNAVTYPMIYAYLDDPVQAYAGFADAILNVSATDGFKILANKLVSGDFPAQRSDVRIAAMLDAAGWSASKRSLATGVSFLDAITLDKVSALDHIQQVADSESGRFFMAADGDATFLDRHTQYLTTSQATFGENEINYVDVIFAGGDQLIYNEILAQRLTAGSEQRTAVDATSQDDYLTRTLSYTGLLIDTDNESEDKADFSLALFKDFHPRIVGLILDGTYQPLSVWPQALGRELGDRLTVRKRPPGGGLLIEQESFIEGIEHTVGVGAWDTVIRLTAVGIGYQIYALGKSFFELGHATRGLLNGNGVLTY